MPDSYPETTEESIIPEKSEERKSEIKSFLEREVLELEKKLTEKRKELERKIERKPAKEEIEIKEVEELEEISLPAIPSITPTQQQIQEQVKQIKNLDRQNQVKVLCDLAFQKNLNLAIEVARSLDNAYVLDEFHDTLVDKLYQELIKRGKLEEI